MEESPVKPKNPSSRVIDSLHQEIDSLKTEVESLKTSSEDYKKKYSLTAKKNDSIVDQLANTKHENDMINALLKRKERRISDLEDQYNDLISANDSLQLNNKNMKIRCENLQESSASSTAEFERLKIAYDALIASQVEYKRHYSKELTQLTTQFEAYKVENQSRYEILSSKLLNNDKDVDTLLDSLTNKRKTMDNLYVNKNKTILELLTKLARTARLHGQESKMTLQDSFDIIQALVAKHPDLQDKISQHEKIDIDLEEILSETQETLSNCSFDEETAALSSNSPDPDSNSNTPNRQLGHQKTPSLTRNSTIQSKRRKNKRNSLRFDSKSAPDFSNINTPTTPTQLTLPKRPNMALQPQGLQSQQNFTQQVQPQSLQQQSQPNRNSYYDTSKPRTPTPPSNNNHNHLNDSHYELNPNYQYNHQQYGQFNGGQVSGAPHHSQQYNNNSGNQRNFRNSSQSYGNINNNNNIVSNGGNINQMNLQQQMNSMNQLNQIQMNQMNGNQINGGNNKKFNRRSAYNGSNGAINNNSNQFQNKRNSQSFDPNMNLALNT